jgi:hypothetical protein
LGCEIDGRGEEDAVFEVRKEEMQFEGFSADKAARVLGVAEIGSHDRSDICCRFLILQSLRSRKSTTPCEHSDEK